jgi:hypothetical protein
MSKPSLDSAYALIGRASEHLNELKIIHNQVAAAQAKATVLKHVDFNIPPGETGVIAEGEVLEHVPIPDKARILIGEIANGLRSSLNYLASRLSELDCGVKRKSAQLQFPIEASKERFVGQRKNYLAGISDAHVAAIERLQPYNGCDWMAHLQRLSNLHKHEDLIMILHLYNLHFSVTPAQDDPTAARMDVQLEPSLFIALRDGLPVIETLEVLQTHVAQTLDAFKPEF